MNKPLVMIVGDVESPHVQRWAQALATRVSVDLVGFGDVQLPEINFISLGPTSKSKLRFLKSTRRLATIVKDRKPDIVHAHFVSSYGVMAAALRHGPPLVLTAWGSDLLTLSSKRWWHRRLVRWTLRRAAVVTGDSNDLIDVARKLAPATTTERILFGPSRQWCQLAVDKKPVVVSLRQLRPLYNVDAIVQAFLKISAAYPDWTLRVMTYGVDPSVVGIPPESSPSKIVPLGSLSRDEIFSELSAAALVVSVPSSDGTAASLLESMALGAVPIVSDLPANREWIQDKENGRIVAVRDVDALALALSESMRDHEWRQRAGAINRSLIDAGNTWEDNLEKMLAIYARLP